VSRKTLIGILGGMGPRSTSPFLELVLDECQRQYGAEFDADYPPIMIYSLPTPFYVDKPIDHTLMEETIIKGLRKLESTGVGFITIPCNSAHIYFNKLERTVNIPLLNIVEETVKHLPEEHTKITLFATSVTFESMIYQKKIESIGHKFIFNKEWQVTINEIIKSIKSNKSPKETTVKWNELIMRVRKEDITHVVVACTDLNILVTGIRGTLNMIDSARCLAEATVKKYLMIESL
jgi:aspartate racemase